MENINYLIKIKKGNYGIFANFLVIINWLYNTENERNKYNIKIDWDKRYKLMKLHFSAELVLELVYQGFNQPEKIGANITSDKARVDFFWNGNISETFPALESKIKTMVDSDLPIVSDYIDVDSERRYWEIEGFAKVDCGGTHLRRMGEIGRISLKRNNIGKGKERIEIYLISG